MLRSLSSRLLLAFAFVIVLSLAVSAVGTLFLLRDQQREAAEEPVGRPAEPIPLAVALLEGAGLDERQIQDAIRGYADAFDVRVVLVDSEGRVGVDTESGLTGQELGVFRAPGPVTKRGSAHFRMTSYRVGSDDLRLFAAARESLHLSSNSLAELQTWSYFLDPSSLSQNVLEEEL